MKVLLIDMLSPSGHVNYNVGLIRIISSGNNSVVFCAQNEMICNVREHIDMIEDFVEMPEVLFLNNNIDLPGSIFTPIIWRMRLVNWFFNKLNYINQFEYVLFSSSEPFVMSLLSHKLKVKNGFVDHGIGKIGESFLYKFCYKYLLSTDTKIIVLEEYICEYVQKILRKESSVLYHPLVTHLNEDHIVNKRGFLLFAPSGGNDEEFIKHLVTFKYKLPTNTKIVVRSRLMEHSDDKLIVYKERLSSEKYNYYMKLASAILIPYEKSYNYRTSAVFFEAMANKKPVFILRNNTLVHLSKKFPKISFLISNVHDLVNALPQSVNIDDSAYIEVLQHYSDENILKQFQNLLWTPHPKS